LLVLVYLLISITIISVIFVPEEDEL